MTKKTLNLSLSRCIRSVSPVVFSSLSFFLLLPAFARPDEVFLENAAPHPRGPDVGFLPDTPTREKIDLSGQWRYEVEEGGSGVVGLPASGDFVGSTTFSRTFEVTRSLAEHYTFHLVMVGANYECSAFVNGEFISSHSGGYTSFVREIPPNAIQPGAENQVRLVVTNELDDRDTIPLKFQVWGWRNYGGVLRDCYLLATPKLFIKDVRIHSSFTADGASGLVSVDAVIEGEEPPPTDDPGKKSSLGLYAEIVDRITGEIAGRSKTSGVQQTEDGWTANQAALTINTPKLWHPDHPDLYQVKIALVRTVGSESSIIDEVHVNHGFREIRIDEGDIRLNGARVILNGVVWNEDHPSWGSSLPYHQMEKDVVLIKNLGANAVCFGGHPPHPYMLNLCDRYGLLALVELPVAYSPASILTTEYQSELTRSMLREMILRDRNHPSVLAWGIGEGFESSSEASRSYVESLVSTAKELDDRPVYYASVMPAADVCSDLVDIAGITMFTRDPAAFRQRLESWKARNPSKPVIVAKFGTEVEHDNRNGYTDPLSNEAQARFFLQRFDDIRSLKYDGAFVWALNDWRADRPSLTVASGDPGMHTMGLVSDRREKRLAFDAVRSLFRGEKFVALPAGSYSSTAPIVYVLSGLILLIGTAYFYNADRRFRESANRSVLNSYNFFSDIRDQRVVSVFHSTVLGIITSAAMAVVVSTALSYWRQSWLLDAALSYVIGSDAMKEFVIQMIRSPLTLILYLTGLFFLLLLLTSIGAYVLARLLKARLFLYHAYSLTTWATVPLLVLIPLGMILFRLLESGEYVVPSVMLVCFLNLWMVTRLFKGLAIVADVFRPKIYAIGLSSIIGIIAAGYFVLDYSQSASEYLTFLYTVASNAY